MSMQFQSPFQQEQSDIFEWHPLFVSCLRYFIDHAQYSPAVQTVAACVNILLPFQKGNLHPLTPNRTGPSSSSSSSRASGPGNLPLGVPTATSVTLIPYIRRLIVTGFDTPAVLHGFFGDDWAQGIGRVHESERRNYMFAAKSDNWLRVKTQYDMDDGQTVPFLRPLQNVTEEEIQAAESNWSEWLAMQDWMLGPRAPPDIGDRFVRVKKEQD
ncbi:ilp is an apoptosis inhibitor [Fusarium austroafricanum]|uniref:Ilp is an apoptosis inhibitor n=1 Tax=Fusarium austroafricanum TaxID=2364996 RepID=A0A8H4PC09_9HYPO|nr:ilp is an apoptosis inhibitor [Fusarium austroafricanum]